MAEPPSEPGVNEIVAWFGDDVAAETLVGASGTEELTQDEVVNV